MSDSKINISADIKIGFIGAGQMATALIKGLIEAKLVSPSQIMASDMWQPTLDRHAKDNKINVTTSNQELVAFADIIFIATKPNVVPIVLKEISAASGNKLFISIAAGVKIETMSNLLPETARIVRVMPNTPALVGAMAAGYSPGPGVSDEQVKMVESLLSATGVAHKIPEKYIDAVTGLSGSGPAYIFVLIEAMADGGVRMGLPRAVAQSLAAQTVFGSAKMVLETGKHPGQLKDAVASPGGTTIAGLHELEKGGFRATIMNAVKAAAEKSTELSKL